MFSGQLRLTKLYIYQLFPIINFESKIIKKFKTGENFIKLHIKISKS